jgi:hypothetical protein
VTNLLPLLTVTLALASLIQVAKSAHPLVLFLVLGRRELAAEAYERSAGAAGLTAATAFCPGPGLWVLGVPFAVTAAVLALLWRREKEKGRAW